MATTSSGRFLAGQALDEVLDGGHARRATNHHDVGDVGLRYPSVLDGLLERHLAAVNEVGRHLLELGSSELHIEVLRSVARGSDERQVDLRLLDLAQLDLGLLRGLLQTLQSHLVLRQVDAFGAAEILDEPINDGLIPVVATEVRVAVS
jgi:hypothetical protein